MPDIYKLRQKQIASFEKSFEPFITDLNKSIRAGLRDLDTVNGLIVPDNEALETAIQVRQEISKAIVDYDVLVEASVKQSKDIFTAIKINARSVLDRQRLGGIDKLTVDALIRSQDIIMKDISDKFSSELGRALNQNVMGGVSLEDTLELIDSKVEAFANEALTNLRTIKNDFSQNAEDLVAESVGFGDEEDDIWEYIGAPLQDNSHKECIWALTQKPGFPYFTNAERIEFESGGGFPHTEPRWNCQHNFFMSNVTHEEAFGAAA